MKNLLRFIELFEDFFSRLYMYNFLVPSNNTKETEHEIETNVRANAVLISCFRKSSHNQQVLEKILWILILNRISLWLFSFNVNFTFMLLLFYLVSTYYNTYTCNCLRRCYITLLLMYIKSYVNLYHTLIEVNKKFLPQYKK